MRGQPDYAAQSSLVLLVAWFGVWTRKLATRRSWVRFRVLASAADRRELREIAAQLPGFRRQHPTQGGILRVLAPTPRDTVAVSGGGEKHWSLAQAAGKAMSWSRGWAALPGAALPEPLPTDS